jgi:DNA modification methylase
MMMIYTSNEFFTLYHGDNREVLKQLPDNSIDSVVTDPPYELGFMGKKWDSTGIAYDVELWREVLRVLKPGGHLLSFSGSRTYHRMAVAIEDAGFEVRDQIMWIYGSGFPKSLDISKQIDKNNGEANRLLKFTTWMRTTGVTSAQLNQATGTLMGGHYLTTASQPAIPTVALWQKIRPLIAEVPEWVDELVERIEAEREVVGVSTNGAGNGSVVGLGSPAAMSKTFNLTAPATDAAKQWQGWGTALKPAHEPIVLARKPVTATVAANVLEWGVGGLNIDQTRVAMGDEYDPTKIQRQQNSAGAIDGAFGAASLIGKEIQTYKEGGRWPANVIHDGSDEVVELFPDSKSGSGNKNVANRDGLFGKLGKGNSEGIGGDSGSAARFFYCAKANKRDRNEGLDGFEKRQGGGMSGTVEKSLKTGSGNERDGMQANFHPTVKPTDLMAYLCRLVTPKGGTVLDPFMGSGSTGKAAMYEGFKFIGIEMTDEYLPIAKARIEFAFNEESEKLPNADVSI